MDDDEAAAFYENPENRRPAGPPRRRQGQARITPERRAHLFGEPPSGPCEHCGQREASLVWTTSGTDAVHGNFEWWCELCAASAQLDHAKSRAAAIPALEAEVARLQAQP